MLFDTFIDYQVLCDGSFTLNAAPSVLEPSDLALRFTVPEDLHVPHTRLRPPVLTFKIEPLEDCEVLVRMGTQELARLSYAQGDACRRRGVLTLCDACWQASHPLDLCVQLTKGRCRFADVVIWYKVNHARSQRVATKHPHHSARQKSWPEKRAQRCALAV